VSTTSTEGAESTTGAVSTMTAPTALERAARFALLAALFHCRSGR
jgi:hypothetical protein